jgi:hypothetical protein
VERELEALGDLEKEERERDGEVLPPRSVLAAGEEETVIEIGAEVEWEMALCWYRRRLERSACTHTHHARTHCSYTVDSLVPLFLRRVISRKFAKSRILNFSASEHN